MSSTKKSKLLKTLLTANIAGCGCGKPKLSDVIEPIPKPKIKIHKNPIRQPHSTSSSCDKNDMSFTVDDEDEDQCTSTTISFNNNSSSSHPSDSAESTNPKNTKILTRATSTKINNSIAVVKESNDPYEDFRQSMLQMIVEKQIYSKEDLQELLSCFLELNSASHHDVIIQAFTQIWNDLIRDRKKSNDHVNPS